MTKSGGEGLFVLQEHNTGLCQFFLTNLLFSTIISGYPARYRISGINDQPDIRYPAKIVFGSSLILCIIESFHRILNAWKYIEENHKNNRYSLYLKIKYNKV